jgi:DNA repair photolyase
MEEIKINGKAIYTTKGAAREYGRVGCNFYTGCPHECSYCYLKRGAPSKQLGGNVVQLKKCFKDDGDALEVFCKEARKHADVLKKTGVFFSFTTDPMLLETRDLTLSAINYCIYNDIPVKILTKEARFVNYDRFMVNHISNAFKEMVSIGFTLTGCDGMEPKASSNYDRIQAMRLLHTNGFKTWASIEPVIDWQRTRMVVEMSLDCCDHYKIGLRSGVGKDYYDLVQSGYFIEGLVKTIAIHGRTVYLKESTRKLLQRCYKEDYYNHILSFTLDMDGNNYQKENEHGE